MGNFFHSIRTITYPTGINLKWNIHFILVTEYQINNSLSLVKFTGNQVYRLGDIMYKDLHKKQTPLLRNVPGVKKKTINSYGSLLSFSVSHAKVTS